VKKIVIALFAASLLICIGKGHALASDHFGELNLKGGLILNGKGDVTFEMRNRTKDSKFTMSSDLDHGFSFALEYLIPCSHFFQDENLFKFGLGLGYLPSLKIKEFKDAPNDFRLSCLPIYFTLQVNPFPSQHELLHRIFIKGNIGYSLNLSNDQILSDGIINKNKGIIKLLNIAQISKRSNVGGIYYGLSAGYEFPVGIIIDLAYCVYNFGSECKYSSNIGDFDMNLGYTSQFVALTAGYKFKI
jgi:hypothetical protein